MEVVQILHMNKGDGETSYAQNSKVQNKIMSISKPIIDEAVQGVLCSSNVPIESMGIADLGCSSGPNTLLLISEIMDVVHAQLNNRGGPHRILSTTEFRVFLNDLFSNDFNSIFMSLPEFYTKLRAQTGAQFGPIFISAVPSSFYGRLFPTMSLHFVHSSSSLHWLSQVPSGLDKAVNKGKIYISKTSPNTVVEAYSLQFHKDFSLFLKSRAQEIVGGGRMVLSLMGRPSFDPTTPQSCYQWELLAHALSAMVSEGLIEEEKVDSFNAPYYAPSAEELKLELQEEGSFVVDRLEAFEIDWDGTDGADQVTRNGMWDPIASARLVAKTIRAVVESMIESHFGEEIMDDLFRRYTELVGDHLSRTRTKYINLVISVIRKD